MQSACRERKEKENGPTRYVMLDERCVGLGPGLFLNCYSYSEEEEREEREEREDVDVRLEWCGRG